MKNLGKSETYNTLKHYFIFLNEGPEKITQTESVIAKKETPQNISTEIANREKETVKGNEITEKNNKALDSVINNESEKINVEGKISTSDLLAKVNNLDPAIPQNLINKIETALSSKKLDQKKLNNLIATAFIGQSNIPVVSDIQEVTIPVKIGEVWSHLKKNPFPNGEDDLQNKLSNRNIQTAARGYVHENGCSYYDNSGKKIESPDPKLPDVIKADLAPLAKTNISAEKLHQIISNDNFTKNNAETIINAMKTGEVSSVRDLQVAFSNISEEFAGLVSGLDNKYGENTRITVRTLAVALSNIVTESTQTVVKYTSKKIDKWHVAHETIQSFGDGSSNGWAHSSAEIKSFIRTQNSDNDKNKGIEKFDNGFNFTPYSEGKPLSTIKVKNREYSITNMPKELKNSIQKAKDLAAKRAPAIEAKAKKQAALNAIRLARKEKLSKKRTAVIAARKERQNS